MTKGLTHQAKALTDTQFRALLRFVEDETQFPERNRVVVLLSDCRATDEEDPVPAATHLPELVILAPHEDCEQAAALAEASGSRYAAIDGAESVPALLEQLLA